MILVRDVFRLKFGKAKEAMAIMKDLLPMMEKSAPGPKSSRLLVDLVGNYYTVVLESTYESLEGFENAHKAVPPSEEWQRGYQKFVPLVDSGYREIFTIVSVASSV